MKQRAVAERLSEMHAVCGEHIGRRLCLRPPGHAGGHSDRFEKRRPTREERLQREFAKKSVIAERRDRHRRHLQRVVAAQNERIAWMESYPLFRLEFRLRGMYRRMRRYVCWARSRWL